MKTITVYEKETNEKVVKKYYESNEEAYNWFHDNYDEEHYYYIKIG